MKKLNKLIKYLENLNEVEPSAFSLTEWISSEKPKNLKKAIKEWQSRYKEGKKLNCGTSACVVGHLPNIFPKDFKWGFSHNATAGFVRHSSNEDSNIDIGVLSDYFGGTSSEWLNIIYELNYSVSDPPLSMVLERIKKLRDRLTEKV